VLLVIDHIEPVAKGGTNDILNLIAACKDCNSGKSDRVLTDTSILDKQRQQLEDLQERKEQIEMMFQWQKGLLGLDDQVIDQLAKYWSEKVEGYSLNENGINGLKRLKRKFEIDEIMSAINIAVEKYIEYKDGNPTQESVDLAWKKVGGICTFKRLEKEDPDGSRLYYIRGILRNRLRYLNYPMAIQLLRAAVEANASIDSLEEHAKNVRNWSNWCDDITNFIKIQKRENKKNKRRENQVEQPFKSATGD
jgi:5-methylcytosine-specific restriction endonuclease McrA